MNIFYQSLICININMKHTDQIQQHKVLGSIDESFPFGVASAEGHLFIQQSSRNVLLCVRDHCHGFKQIKHCVSMQTCSLSHINVSIAISNLSSQMIIEFYKKKILSIVADLGNFSVFATSVGYTCSTIFFAMRICEGSFSMCSKMGGY